MTFFNKKEDVLEFKLTPYGRKLLSHGKLKPEFYAFFDDDILYDSEKGGFSETNSESKNRILIETPYLRTQHVNFGVETTLATDPIKHPGSIVLDNFMPNPIGTNSHVEKNTAGWKIISLDKEYSDFSLTSSLPVVKIDSTTAVSQGQPILNIPQIDLTMEFTMSLDNVDTFFGDYSDLANEFDLQQEGDSFIKLEKEQGVFYFLEKNGFLNKDSFEVEVFIQEENTNGFKKLEFASSPSLIQNDILMMGNEAQTNNQQPIGVSLTDGSTFSFDYATQTNNEQPMDISSNNVEFYLNFLLDKEVPDEDICKGISKLRESDIYLGYELDCPDLEDIPLDIYSSTLGDIEECDDGSG